MIGGRVVRSIEAVIAALRRSVVAEVQDLNRLVSHILRGGVLVSVAVLVAGFAVALVQGTPAPSNADPPGRVLRDAIQLRPEGLLSLGILLIIATPIARVVLSIVSFAKEGDARFAAIASIVLLNLIIGLALGLV